MFCCVNSVIIVINANDLLCALHGSRVVLVYVRRAIHVIMPIAANHKSIVSTPPDSSVTSSRGYESSPGPFV